jgi:outer membrane protein assembly factor BamB
VSVGLVTLVEGKVQFKTSPSDAWKDADIGDTIPVTGAVKTEEAASCELQFGKAAIVHILAKSTLEIRAIDISQAKRSVELSLLNGALVAKVDKLVGTRDRFQVRTDAAVCAVRGTRFLVRCTSNSSTSVAVSEGSVALIPASYDAAHFEVTTTNTATDTTKEELAATLAHGLLNGSPLVEPDQEATVTKASLESLDTALASAVEATDSGNKAALTKALDDYRNATGGSPSPASAVGEDSRRVFQETKDLHISDNLPPIKETAPAEKAESLSPAAQEVRPLSLPLKPPAIYNTVAVSHYPLVGGLAAADSRLYASDSHADIAAFDREGKVYWSVDSKNGSNENSSPVAQGGLVLFAGGKDLALYDATSGDARSSFDLGKADSGLFGRRPLLVGGKVLLSSETGLAVFDPAGKEAVSAAALPEASDASLSVYGEDAVVLTRGGILCVVDGASLAVKAQIRTGSTQSIAVRPIIVRDLAYVVDRKGLVSCVDLAAKKLLWEKRLDSGASVEAFSDPLVTEAGLYIVAKSTLYALSPVTGEVLFRPIAGVDSSPVAGDGLLWLGADGKSIIGIDPKTGTRTLAIKVGTPVSAAPIADGDLLAFPLANGRVVFINPKYRP